jgi:hypothetical protein
MSVSDNTSVHSRTISAFFDTSGAARKAVDDLVAAGIPRQHITQTAGHGAAADPVEEAPDHGFWDSLKDLFMPAEDRHSYAEGLRRGGYLIAVRSDEANYNRVLDILDSDGAVDMDERERQWRHDGWVGLGGDLDGLRGPATSVPAAGVDAVTPSVPVGPAFGSAATDGLGYGRRDLGHGRARVRSYMPGTAPDGSPVGLTDAAPRFTAADASLIIPHMDVISADGQKIGEVDHLDGPDRIKLSKNASPDGQHHMVPFAWIDHVDRHVHLRRTLAEIKAGR